MSLGTLALLSSRPATELCRHAGLGAQAGAWLGDDPTPRLFLERLLDGNRHEDAARFLAHALPERESVWWGCLCLGHALHLGPTSPVPAALEAAVRWVVEPSERNRAAAKGPGEEARMTTPMGCLAMAASWSGGGTRPPGLPGASPSPLLTARAVGDGILLAAVQGDPAGSAGLLRRFLALGLGVADGKYLWGASSGASAGTAPGPATRPSERAEGRRYGDWGEPGR
jgi:hypothetical protein